MRVWTFYPAGVWASVALWLFACVSNGGYAKMNALFTAKNLYRYSCAHCIGRHSRTGFARLKIGRVYDETEDP